MLSSIIVICYECCVVLLQYYRHCKVCVLFVRLPLKYKNNVDYLKEFTCDIVA